ncbi:MAG: 30S ribosomal protein S1 [Clostridia bacterium]|nr:30S ribosomal protein S1 [Clostridia bacterium]
MRGAGTYTTGRGAESPGFSPEGLWEEQPGGYTRSALESARESGCVLEGWVTLCDAQYTLWVDLGCMRGRIVREEVQLCPWGEEVRDIAVITRVGKRAAFVVMGFDRTEDGEEIAVLSRRGAQRLCREAFLDRCVPGDVLRARVTHLEPFGAFVDVGCGIVSMLPIDAISVSRIAHPGDRFALGQAIWVVLRSVEVGGRICISHKELLGTWEQNAKRFQPGQTVSGIVRSVEEYGVFVELTPNLAGLAEYREDVAVGQRAAVYIKSMTGERMKVKLVFVDTYRGGGGGGTLHYYLPEQCRIPGVPHIDVWRYSPPGAVRCIESVFH